MLVRPYLSIFSAKEFCSVEFLFPLPFPVWLPPLAILFDFRLLCRQAELFSVSPLCAADGVAAEDDAATLLLAT